MNERGFWTSLKDTATIMIIYFAFLLSCQTNVATRIGRGFWAAAPLQPGSLRSSGVGPGAPPIPVGRGPAAEPAEPTVLRPGVCLLLGGRPDQTWCDRS